MDTAPIVALAGPIAVGLVGGFFGSLLGLGGGIVVVPLLTLAFGMPMHAAVAVSLLGVVATSLASSARYLRVGLVDVRLAVTLESASIAGALAGSLAVPYVPARTLALLFAAVMTASAWQLVRAGAAGSDRDEIRSRHGAPLYRMRGLGFGLAASGVAGVLSGLLGVGGGIVKIPAMILRMGVPTRVALATSSFMIGLTAAASALVTAARGAMPLRPAAGVVLGILAGATLGSRVAGRVPANRLRQLVAAVLVYAAVRLALDGGQR